VPILLLILLARQPAEIAHASLASHPVNSVSQQALAFPPDPTADIPWSAGTSGVADVQAAFNTARAVENSQLGAAIPMMTLPGQSEWNAMSDGEKALWLINRERIDRSVLPLEDLETNVNGVAQYYADYLLDNNLWGHSADGRSPWERLEANPAIGACQDFLSIAENLAVFVTSGSGISLPIERSIYMWMYEDGSCCGWGHRHAILYYPYNDNSGPAGREGFLGIGRANGGPYQGPFTQPWPFAEIIVMNVFDPCAGWAYAGPVVTDIVPADPNPNNISSVRYTVTFSTAVTGVDTTDFSLTTTGGISGAALGGVSGSGSTRTVTIQTGSGSGTLRLDLLDDDSIQDASGKPLGGVGTGNGNFTDGGVYSINKEGTFLDVPVNYWARDWIERLYAAGITGGCSANPIAYCPDQAVTRAQMAVFLERGMNGPSYSPPAAAGTVFADVTAAYWAAAWIEKLAADRVTAGCGSGNYCPEAEVTRAQMAIFLLRSRHGSDYTPPAAIGVFTDVPVSHWAAAWIEQLAAERITGGCGTGIYCPESPVTRAQMAVFLVRGFNLP